jgi:hypothetical protein
VTTFDKDPEGETPYAVAIAAALRRLREIAGISETVADGDEEKILGATAEFVRALAQPAEMRSSKRFLIKKTETRIPTLPDFLEEGAED